MDEPIVLGVFREFGYGDSAPSLREVVGGLDVSDRESVAEYLDGGVALTAVPGSEPDLLDGSAVSVSSSTLTDGVYVWRRDLSHYVRKYGVELPAAFVATVRSGQVPPTEIEPERYRKLATWVADRIRERTL